MIELDDLAVNFHDQLTISTDVTNSYRLLLGRDAESVEVISQKTGVLVDDLLNELVSSREFHEYVVSSLSLGQLPADRYHGAPDLGLTDWLAERRLVSISTEIVCREQTSWRDWLAVVYQDETLLSRSGQRETLRQVHQGLKAGLSGGSSTENPTTWESTTSYEEGLRRVLQSYPIFDARWYSDQHHDVASFSAGPEEHFIRFGARDGRAPNALFDPAYYRANVGRSIPENMSEVEDYLSRGWLEGRAPSESFDSVAYLEEYADLARHPFEPLTHFVQHGRKEGRRLFAVDAHALKRGGGTLPIVQPKQQKALVDLGDLRFGDKAVTFDPGCLRIDWVIPDFAPGAGGHMAIFKTIEHLERLGHRLTLWIDYPNQRASALEAYNEILCCFRPLKSVVRLLTPSDQISTDVVFATDNWTVYTVAKHFKAKLFVQFVQDFEPWFFGMGSDYLLSERTYQADMLAVCSSPWLENLMRGKGRKAISFIYPADDQHYFPAEVNPAVEPPLIAFYARAFTSRRAVELGLLALARLAEKGTKFRVALFGQDHGADPAWPFPAENLGVLNEAQLGDLFRRSTIGMVFSATNYSITAVEMMASGLPIVDLDVPSTRETYPKGGATLAPADPAAIADAIAALLNDGEGRRRQAEVARDWIGGYRWKDNVGLIQQTLVAELEVKGYSARQSAKVHGQTDAAVVIPTLNSGDKLVAVLHALQTQECPFPFEIVCIDSGSTDGSVDFLRSQPAVKLHQIPKSEFNHGDTRNLGVSLTQASYVAFLTDDAIPATDRWLYHLVGVLDAVPGAAGAFGRHLPHQGASPFTGRDLRNHFDNLRRGPAIITAETRRPEFEARDPAWMQHARFYSDNNSALKRSVWERIPLPSINFGEDQVWALQILMAGYAKVYVDEAGVYHSHEYTPEETRKRARTEAAFYRLRFGDAPSVASQQQLEDSLGYLNARDVTFSMRNHLAPELLAQQLALNAAALEGHLQGSRDTEVVY